VRALGRAFELTIEKLKVLGEHVDAFAAMFAALAAVFAIAGFKNPLFLPLGLLAGLGAGLFAFILIRLRFNPPPKLPNESLTVVSDDVVHNVFATRRTHHRTLRLRAHRQIDYCWLRFGWTGSGPHTIKLCSGGQRLDGPLKGCLPYPSIWYYKIWFEPPLSRNAEASVQLEMELEDPNNASEHYVSVSYNLWRRCLALSIRVIFAERPREVTYSIMGSSMHPVPIESRQLIPDHYTNEASVNVLKPEGTRSYQIAWEP